MSAAAKAFTAAVTKRAKLSKSSSKAMSAALGALVTARVRKRSEQAAEKRRIAARWEQEQSVKRQAEALPKAHRRRMRRGRPMHYKSTGKVDISRLGTFRHYLISTVRKYENTWEAQDAHANCDNPKWAKNKLDFAWVAAEGYIEFVVKGGSDDRHY